MKISISISKYGPGVYTGKSGLYSAVEPTKKSVADLTKLCTRAGIVELESDLHCTIMYSPNKCLPESSATKWSKNQYKAVGKKFRWWVGHDNAGYLILELDSPELEKEHLRLKELGCVSTFPNYVPHLTLRNNFYFKDEDEQKSRLRSANLILRRNPLDLVLTDQKVEDIKL